MLSYGLNHQLRKSYSQNCGDSSSIPHNNSPFSLLGCRVLLLDAGLEGDELNECRTGKVSSVWESKDVQGWDSPFKVWEKRSATCAGIAAIDFLSGSCLPPTSLFLFFLFCQGGLAEACLRNAQLLVLSLRTLSAIFALQTSCNINAGKPTFNGSKTAEWTSVTLRSTCPMLL